MASDITLSEVGQRQFKLCSARDQNLMLDLNADCSQVNVEPVCFMES
jgi:hypothetical protein